MGRGQHDLLDRPQESAGTAAHPFLPDLTIEGRIRQEPDRFGDLRKVLVCISAKEKGNENIAVCTQAGITFSGICDKVFARLVGLDEVLDAAIKS